MLRNKMSFTGSKTFKEKNPFSEQINEKLTQNNEGLMNYVKSFNQIPQNFSSSTGKQDLQNSKTQSSQDRNNKISQNKWSEEEIETLFKLYEEHGPNWVLFSQVLQDRSYSSIKNRFTNGLRRICKLLSDCEGIIYKNIKKTINNQMLSSMIDFVNQVQKSIKDHGLKLNYESKLFDFRSKMIKLCLGNEEISQELFSLVKIIKFLNSKIRCYGIFKVKNRRTWKISSRVLQTIKKFDKIFLEEQFVIKTQTQLQQNQNYKLIEVSSSQQIFSQSSSAYLNLPMLRTELEKSKNAFYPEERELISIAYQILGEYPITHYDITLFE